ncbi:MAG: PorV/PorQ family protein [Ignavibacteriota bacterium]|nr:MAG: hypothetical protein EDM72_06680 [Chlorobiota bacterium]MBL1121678.1 hypothetical protein [Ignavibacteriota bacterium]MCC7094467.1 PorV/PorQ family protein [Ignavibacteriaceae bacterium]NUM61771.1 PorV/PorQ family protein [Ignavibacteriaceae bacterium]QKJ97359.1 MAG: PorV/PorQ family protein [Ignavibacteriota bacterium]
MKNLFYISLIFIIMTDVMFSQLFPVLGDQRAGISTAQFLKIGVGGRAAALGESFIAISDDASALYWNPAGLAQFNKNQLIISHNIWVADINHDFIGAVYHLDSENSFGASLTAVTMDDMPVTTEFAPFGTGEYFSFTDIAISLSYARRMTDQFSFGGTVKYVEETLDKLKMRGVMIDLGTFYRTGLGSTRFAVTVSNFGAELAPDGDVVLIGNRTNSEWQSFAPPTIFRVGFAFEPYETEEHRITTSIQLNHPNDNSENIVLGAEYAWQKMFFLRGGYKFNVDEQNYSFGLGLNVPLSIAEFTLDYAFTNFQRLGSAHRFSIMLGL